MPKVTVSKEKGLVQATSDSNNSSLNVNSAFVYGNAFSMNAADEAEAAAATTIPVDRTLILVSQVNDANDRV